MICPNCQNNIDDDSKFCRFCGVEFIGEETVIDIEPDEEELLNLLQSAIK